MNQQNGHFCLTVFPNSIFFLSAAGVESLKGWCWVIASWNSSSEHITTSFWLHLRCLLKISSMQKQLERVAVANRQQLSDQWIWRCFVVKSIESIKGGLEKSAGRWRNASTYPPASCHIAVIHQFKFLYVGVWMQTNPARSFYFYFYFFSEYMRALYIV